ncbi:hypothetical protein [Clostridium swellfunianum]|nr:hypothetical protein [Clostridium swellfunianum]
MRKLICNECGTIWYTSNNLDDSICENCGEILVEDIEVNIDDRQS